MNLMDDMGYRWKLSQDRFKKVLVLLDNLMLVACENDHFGEIALCREAIDSLVSIGILTGLNGQKRIEMGKRNER